MNPETLVELWNANLDGSVSLHHDLGPVQDGSRVFAQTDKTLTAFVASDGSILWSTEDGFGNIRVSDYGLLVSGPGGLELRDVRTGEVRRVWPHIGSVAQIAVNGRHAAISAYENILWLVDLSGQGTISVE